MLYIQSRVVAFMPKDALLIAPAIEAMEFFFQRYVDHRDLHSFPTRRSSDLREGSGCRGPAPRGPGEAQRERGGFAGSDRKSTRLNSSHVAISYAVFCLKKKKK